MVAEKKEWKLCCQTAAIVKNVAPERKSTGVHLSKSDAVLEELGLMERAPRVTAHLQSLFLFTASSLCQALPQNKTTHLSPCRPREAGKGSTGM